MKSIKIGLTCFMGGLIGTFIGLRFFEYWFIAAAIGALVGYLLWDLPKVIVAVPSACKYAYGHVVKIKFKKPAWKWENIKTYILMFIAGNFCCVIPLMLVGLLYGNNWNLGKFLIGMQKEIRDLPGLFFTVLFLMCFVGTMVPLILSKDTSLKTSEGKLQVKRISVWMLKYLNPIIAPFTLIYYGFFVAWQIGIFVRKFVPKFFRLIHSEIRIICAVDSAIGAGVGYLLGNPILGGLIGGVLGLLNYWIVSIKILKLQPK